MKESEVKALISLLEDPDEEISSQVTEKILTLGKEIVPMLESYWEQSFDALQQKRIEEIIHKIHFSSVAKSLSLWATLGGRDLMQGAILVAKYQYPDLNELKLKTHLDLIKQDTWIELNPNLTALEKIKVINHILYEIHGFKGNTSNFHAPQNCFINNVLETKKGSPLTLSIIYCVLAQSLNIPIYGVNLPDHFIVCYQDENHEIPDNLVSDKRVYVYVNPFSKGAIFGQNDIDAYLKQIKRNPEKHFYNPCSNIDIIVRLINNLIFSYEKLGYQGKIKELRTLQRSLLLTDDRAEGMDKD